MPIESEHLTFSTIEREMTELFALVGDGFAGATDALLSGDKAAAKTLIERDRLILLSHHVGIGTAF